MSPAIRDLAYVLAAVLFILGLKGLTHPRTAVRGNLLGALGMLVAVVITLFDRDVLDLTWIIAGIVAVIAAGGVTLGGAAWYARRRWSNGPSRYVVMLWAETNIGGVYSTP